MLPPFRVRKLVPADNESSHRPTSDASRRRSSSSLSDGVIRMSKEAYDELLKREPQAALSYLDDEDGDIILVGSSLELGHRLQDPIPAQPKLRNQAYLKVDLANTSSLHAFHVKRQEEVFKEWRELERQTRDAKKEREIRPAAGLPEPIESHQLDKKDTLTSTTPQKKNDISFGEQSPLARNALKLPPSTHNAEQHTKRWASYSSLPASFEPGTMNVTELAGKAEDKTVIAKPNKMSVAAVCNREKDEVTSTASVDATFGSQPIFGKPISVNVATEQKAALNAAEDRRAYLQRLKTSSEFTVPEFVLATGDERSPEEMRFAKWQQANKTDSTFTEVTDARVNPRSDKVEQSAESDDVLPSMLTTGYQPLLSHFNEQLSKLSGSSTSTAGSSASAPAVSVPESRTSAPKPITRNSSTIALPEDRLADSIKSILAGVSQLTAAFSQSKVELNNTLNLARQDFPHGLKDAFKAGATAVDAFRGVVPQNAVSGYCPYSEPYTSTTLGAPTAAPLLTRSSGVDNATKITPITVTDKVETTTTTPKKIAFSDLTKWTPDFIDARRSISYTTRHGVFEPVHEYLVQWVNRPREDGVWISAGTMRSIEALETLMADFDKLLSEQIPCGHDFDDSMNSRKAADWHNSTIGLSAAFLPQLMPVTKEVSSKEAPKTSQTFLKKIQDASQARRAAKITDATASVKSIERAWTIPEDDLLRELLAGKTHTQLHDWRTWGKVAAKFLNRSTESLKKRWDVIKILHPTAEHTAKMDEKSEQSKNVPIWAQRAKTAASKIEEVTPSESVEEHLASRQNKAFERMNAIREALDLERKGQSLDHRKKANEAQQALKSSAATEDRAAPAADYQMQLLLLEQQNKKKLMMTSQEQDVLGVAAASAPAEDKSTTTKSTQASSTSILPPPTSAYDTTKYANTMLAPTTSIPPIPPYQSTFPTYSSTYPNPYISSSYGTSSFPHAMPSAYGSCQSTYGNSTVPYYNSTAPYGSTDYMKSQLDHMRSSRECPQERLQEQRQRLDMSGFAKSSMPATTHDSKATQHDWTTPFGYSNLPPPRAYPRIYTADLNGMSSLVKVGAPPMPFVRPGSYLKTADIAVSKTMATAQASSTQSVETGLASKMAPATSKNSDIKPEGLATTLADSWSPSEFSPQWPTLQFNSAPPAPKMSTATIPVSKDAATKDAQVATKSSLAKSQAHEDVETALAALNTTSLAEKSAAAKTSTSFRPHGSGSRQAPAPEFIDFDTYLNEYGMEADNLEPIRPTPSKVSRSVWVTRCIKNLTEMGYSPAEKVKEISESCDGYLDAAMDLMEEDAAEWKRMSKGKAVMREDEPYAGDEEEWF